MRPAFASFIDELSILLFAVEGKQLNKHYTQIHPLDVFSKKELSHPQYFFTKPNNIPKVELNLYKQDTECNIFTFNFSSPYPSPYKENNTALGRIYRPLNYDKLIAQGKNPSAIIFVHGWRIKNLFFFHRFAKFFAKIGFESILLTLPYHLERKLSGIYSGGYMFSDDGIRTLQSFKQALGEIFALEMWLRNNGTQQVGIIGISLGGWLGGLAICANSDFNFAILITPPSNPQVVWEKSPLAEILRKNFHRKKLPTDLKYFFNLCNTTNYKPQIPKDDILLVKCIHDKMIPPESVDELYESWDKPKMISYPQSHLSIVLFEQDLYKDLLAFLTERGFH